MPGVRRSTTVETFFAWLEQGRVPCPFVPALSEDVYSAYLCFCRSESIDSPSPINDVIRTVVTLGQVRRIAPRMPELDPYGFFVEDSTPRQRRVLLIGFRPSGVPGRDMRRVRRLVRDFRGALSTWRHALSRVSTVTRNAERTLDSSQALESPRPVEGVEGVEGQACVHTCA